MYLCADCSHFMSLKKTRTDIDLVRIWQRCASTGMYVCEYMNMCVHVCAGMYVWTWLRCVSAGMTLHVHTRTYVRTCTLVTAGV